MLKRLSCSSAFTKRQIWTTAVYLKSWCGLFSSSGLFLCLPHRRSGSAFIAFIAGDRQKRSEPSVISSEVYGRSTYSYIVGFNVHGCRCACFTRLCTWGKLSMVLGARPFCVLCCVSDSVSCVLYFGFYSCTKNDVLEVYPVHTLRGSLFIAWYMRIYERHLLRCPAQFCKYRSEKGILCLNHISCQYQVYMHTNGKPACFIYFCSDTLRLLFFFSDRCIGYISLIEKKKMLQAGRLSICWLVHDPHRVKKSHPKV